MYRVYDVCGREIVEGCYLVYASNLGRSAVLKFGKVLGFAEPLQYGYSKTPRIKVFGVNPRGFRAANQRAAFLQFPERTAIIDKRDIPTDVYQIIEIWESLEEGEG